jgi:nucleoid-associated protein YgaU
VLERLKIFEYLAPYNFVLFDHNPEQLKVTRRATGGGRGTPTTNRAANLGSQGQGADQTTMTITKARLVGPDVKPMCDKLIGWLTPSEGIAAALEFLGLPPIGARSPVLLVQWGPPMMGFTFTATMSQVDIQYVRVSALGVPTHAQVTLTLKEEPTLLPMTNPTSGGRPGRSRHVMIADETLMSLAVSAFGAPGAWRAIAEVNGIDDPATLKPGDVVYLPARDELKALAEAAR